ncbi:hypothetical protein ACHAW6_001969 [Cyclotella cf. meneghiniana]
MFKQQAIEKSTYDDSFTVDMSDTSNEERCTTPNGNKRSSSFLKKRSSRHARKSINIADLPEEQRAKAVKFDMDNNGELDEIEMAMMHYDIDGDGNLGLEEIHAIVQEHLRDKNNIGAMRRVIAGLACFTLILALSNLGTSLASAILVKETTADTDTAEIKLKGSMHVMGTQTSAETFQAQEMDVETRRARRAIVVESLVANPFGEHAHRRLGKGGSVCEGKKCDKDIMFDTNFMSQDDVEQIKVKCGLGRVVNVKRSFPGGSVDSNTLCRAGTSIVVKEKKVSPASKRTKGKGKAKTRLGFDMVVESDGKDTVFDCDGKNCFMSGSNLRQKNGEPCNLSHGSDDCESGLVCIQDANDVTSGKCLSNWDEATWYVDWDSHKCVQDCVGGPNCGGEAGNWNEQFATYKLCCDTHLSYLSGGYRECVPDLDFYLGKGEDCSDSRMCRNDLVCKKSPLNGSDRWYCV